MLVILTRPAASRWSEVIGAGIAVTAHIAEEFEIGVGIDDESEKRNAVAERDRRHGPRAGR